MRKDKDIFRIHTRRDMCGKPVCYSVQKRFWRIAGGWFVVKDFMIEDYDGDSDLAYLEALELYDHLRE